MTSDEFLRSIEKRDPQPVYLFLGSGSHGHVIVAEGLIDRMLSAKTGAGLTRHDLSEVELEKSSTMPDHFRYSRIGE